jgi:amino acid transporter
MTVIFGGATAGFATTGATGIPIAYVAVAIILGIWAIGYVAMARQMPNAGAIYTYITHGLGRILGVGAAFVAVPAYFAMGAGLLGGLGYVASDTVNKSFGVSVPWWEFALIGWALIALFAVLRVEFSGRLLGVLLSAEMVIALIYAGVQVAHPAGGRLTYEALSPTQLTAGSAVGAMLVTAITGFVGFENTPVFSEEIKNPRRTVPIATFLAVGLIGLAYAFCSWALTVATGPDHIVDMSAKQGSELAFSLSGPYVGTFLTALGRILFNTSLFAAAMSFHNTVIRYVFALGREGVLPRAFGRVSVRNKAPWLASVVQSLCSAGVIALYAVNHWDPFIKLFFWITVVAGAGVLMLMVATSLAVTVYFTRQWYHARRAATVHAKAAPEDEEQQGSAADRVGVIRGLIAPLASGGLLGWVLWKTLSGFGALLGVDPTSSLRWQFPAAFAVTAALGILWALALRTWRRDVYDGIGRGGHHRRAPIAPTGISAAAGAA